MEREKKSTDRRKHFRHPVACGVAFLRTESGEARWEAEITDISRGGVRILSNHWFEENELLKLDLGQDEDAFSAIVRVVRVRAETEGKWLLGCRFIPELHAQELHALLRTIRRAAAYVSREA
jgi:c-di-GMP-binding flagellar brake protein YcgR